MRMSKEQYNMPLYRLKKNIPLAKAGTIFYYDEAQLKMAWAEDGNCQNDLCADTIVFHESAINDTEWFKQISKGSTDIEYEETDLELGGEKLYNSLRDEFASSALKGFISCGYDMSVEELAVDCCLIADAMMKERAKGLVSPNKFNLT